MKLTQIGKQFSYCSFHVSSVYSGRKCAAPVGYDCLSLSADYWRVFAYNSWLLTSQTADDLDLFIIVPQSAVLLLPDSVVTIIDIIASELVESGTPLPQLTIHSINSDIPSLWSIGNIQSVSTIGKNGKTTVKNIIGPIYEIRPLVHNWATCFFLFLFF